MAIVESIPDDEAASTSARDTSSLRSRSNIPLKSPSTVRDSSASPLLHVIPPKGAAATGDTVAEDETSPEFWDEVFDSLILTVPFSFLYLLLDILVHLQFQHRPTTWGLAERMSKAVPTLGLIVFHTTRHPNHFLTTSFLMSASILSGTRLIWLVNKAGWSVVTAQAPAVGTLWILTIVQLPLSRAVIALLGVAAWTWWTGLKIRP
ncbi:hypothetical protein EHS25_002582 [Saitozyma podzolica]|uniref:DUF7719 domain-containing protein n=1 Tax=Saitozyma podzolica TaxID=1890683 RepID=A0A427YCR4_9TREE|nr:hypothetical protein EHS25_002582 [Saitozyma podzolica]